MNIEPRSDLNTAAVMTVSRGMTEDVRMRGLEAAVRRRDAVLDAVCFAASHFLGTADWDRDVSELLARLGKATEVSRVYLFEGYRDAAGALRRRLRHEWSGPGVSPHTCDPLMVDIEVESQGLGRWKLLEQGDVIHGALASLPQSEQAYFGRLGIRSFAAVPVFTGQTWWGYLGLADELLDREWSRNVLEALQAAAATLGAAIYRGHAEEQLRKRESQLADAQAIAHMGSWDWDIESNMLTGSAEMYRIYGFDPSAALPTGAILSRVHPDDVDAVRAAIDDAVVHGHDFNIEHRVVRAPDDVRIIRAQGRVLHSASGTPIKIIGAGHDITDRKAAEDVGRRLVEEQAARAAAEGAERRAALLAEASRVLGMSFDYQTTLSALTRLTVPALADYCAVDLISRDGAIERVGVAHVDPAKEPLLWELTRWVRAGFPMAHPLRRALVDGESTLLPAVDDAMLAAIQLDEAHGRILWQIRPRSVIAVPLKVSGKIIGVLAMYTSESGRTYGTEDLALAEEVARRAALAVDNARLYHEAELATRARDQMLSIVAHDLRNPLGTMLMVTELLEETLPADSPSLRQVGMMRRAGKQMNRLIQDLLDVKRIEHGRLTVEPRPVLAAPLLSDAAEMLRALAAARTLELSVDAPPELPMVLADPARIQQVISNLVGNAIKFTPRGGRITLRGFPSGDEVRVAVMDTGPGIAADQLPHVFGHYWQGSRSDSRGLGLGLVIAKGIVEAHAGRIWVESTLGAGSSFYFTLPKHESANARM
jgi:signal transduction histidine kinase/PAS domain-containing protein